MPFARSALIALCLFSFTPFSQAMERRLRPLPHDPVVDGAVTGAAVASLLMMEILKGDLAPLSCRWCNPGALDGDLSRSAAWVDAKAAGTASDVMLIALPVGLVSYGLLQSYRLGEPAAGWSDALMIAEATSLAMVLDKAVKYAAGRARPYAWQGRTELYGDPYDRNVSFFSGHTTFAFAVAVSAGTVFMLQEMEGAPWLLGAGLGCATLVGYLRMAADQHYFSDVLVGAAVGSLVGWSIPYLFHRPRGNKLQPGTWLPAPGGIAMVW